MQLISIRWHSPLQSRKDALPKTPRNAIAVAHKLIIIPHAQMPGSIYMTTQQEFCFLAWV